MSSTTCVDCGTVVEGVAGKHRCDACWHSSWLAYLKVRGLKRSRARKADIVVGHPELFVF